MIICCPPKQDLFQPICINSSQDWWKRMLLHLWLEWHFPWAIIVLMYLKSLAWKMVSDTLFSGMDVNILTNYDGTGLPGPPCQVCLAPVVLMQFLSVICSHGSHNLGNCTQALELVEQLVLCPLMPLTLSSECSLGCSGLRALPV